MQTKQYVVLKVGTGQGGVETMTDTEFEVEDSVNETVSNVKALIESPWERGEITSYQITIRTIMIDETLVAQNAQT